MKNRKTLITIVISIFLINVAESLVSTQQMRAVINQLMQRSLIIDNFESTNIDSKLILDIAKKNHVNIASFLNNESTLDHEIKVFLSSNTILDSLSLNKKLDKDVFNSLPYSLSSRNQHEAYYINFYNSIIDFTLIPIYDSVDQNIIVSSDNSENIDRFISALETHDIHIMETDLDYLNNHNPLMRITLGLIFQSAFLVVALFIYILLLIHQQYQSYRYDTILRLQGYLDKDILFDKINTELKLFGVSSSVVTCVYILIFLKGHLRIIGFLKSYFIAFTIVFIIVIVVLSFMQILSFRSNHLDSLRGNRLHSYLYILVIFKFIGVLIFSILIIDHVSKLEELYLEKDVLSKSASLNESIYTLENISGVYDLEYLLNSNESLYEKLSENLTILYSENLTGDAYDETVIYMNNNYFNSLGIVDIHGQDLKAESDDKILVLSNDSNVDLTYQQLQRPILCGFTGLEDCSLVEVIGIKDGYLVPIIGNNAGFIKAPYVIITGQKPRAFNDYNFDVNQNINLEEKLDVHLESLPLRYVNLEIKQNNMKNYIDNHINQLILSLTISTFILTMLIVTLYRVHYDIFKLSYSNLFMNGNNTYNILTSIFGFQILLDGLSIVLVWVFGNRLIYVVMFFLYIIFIEVIAYLSFARNLRQNIIKNIKGG